MKKYYKIVQLNNENKKYIEKESGERLLHIMMMFHNNWSDNVGPSNSFGDPFTLYACNYFNQIFRDLGKNIRVVVPIPYTISREKNT